jgi:dihydroxyacetone kinase
VVGDFVVFKIAGAAADRGDDLDRVEALARKANGATVSFGVAFDGCTFPGKTEPLFRVKPGHMDLGLGIHGEPGIRTVQWMPARELAQVLLEPLLAERPASAGRSTRAAVILNGLGATKYEELFVLWQTLGPLFEQHGIQPVLPEVGEIVTSLDMAGCSLTLTWLDDELEELWTAPADTPAFRRGSVVDLPQFAPIERTGSAAIEQDLSVGSAQSQLAAATTRLAISAMLQTVLDVEEELGRIDAVAGDGDHGIGMVRGLKAADAAAEAIGPTAGVEGVLRAAGAAWADKAGGTSGVLWGAILTAIGAELGNTQAPTTDAVVRAVSAGADALHRLGKCEIGDKTMYDALKPFSDALRDNVSAGMSLIPAWEAAADVATENARKTADLTPRLGRARPLAERSIGTPDAGATSMALVITAVGNILAGNDSRSVLTPTSAGG